MRWFFLLWWRRAALSAPRPRPGPVTISSPLFPPPQMFTNCRSLVDGNYREAGVLLFLNGLALTEGLDYTRRGGQVTMVVPPGPQDVLTARIFAIGSQLGCDLPLRYIAPWSFRLSGAFDSSATSYRIEYGPTIFGTCDGRNPVFTWQVLRSRVQLFRNGILQTVGVDYSAGPTKIIFLPAAVPQAGDFIAIIGF